MKLYLIAALATMLLSSCLKESISDAMLNSQDSGTQGGGSATATLNYTINGNPVHISVNNADSQDPGFYTLGCSKTFYGSNNTIYSLDGLSNSGETSFIFYTDSLKAGNYNYKGTYGDMYFISYNGTNEYVHDPLDSLSFNITSNNNGHISGNFSGRLTPLVSAGNPSNTYGASGSVLIKNGSFQNIPVFY